MENIFKKMHRTFFPSQHNNYKPYILRPKNLFILAVILLIVKFLFFSWYLYFPKTSNFAVVVSSELIDLVNKDRESQGLKSLKINDKLVLAAQNKAMDMLSNGYFAHTSPSGITPWYWLDRSGYTYVAAGENLAKDFTDSSFLHQAWMKSPSHRANILSDKYQEIGIAVVEGEINGKKTVLAVQFFGKTPVKKTVVKTEENKIQSQNIGIGTTQPKNIPPTQIAEQKEIKGLEIEQPKTVSEEKAIETDIALNTVTEESEPIVKKIYFIIAGLLAMVLLLTVFVNIRVQYPGLIFNAVIIIVLIAGIAVFNGQAYLNRGINTLDGGASVINSIQ